MPPGVRKLTDLAVAEDLDDAHDGRKRRHDQAGAEQPRRRHGPGLAGRLPEDEVADERGDEKRNRKRNEHRMDGMAGYFRSAARVWHGRHGGHGRLQKWSSANG